MISPPLLGLIQVSEDTWCQVYSQFYVLYKAGTTLEISAVQGEPPQGKQVPEVSVELPEGYEMTLTGNKKGCLLKRLSFHNNALPVLTIKVSCRRSAQQLFKRYRHRKIHPARRTNLSSYPFLHDRAVSRLFCGFYHSRGHGCPGLFFSGKKSQRKNAAA